MSADSDVQIIDAPPPRSPRSRSTTSPARGSGHVAGAPSKATSSSNLHPAMPSFSTRGGVGGALQSPHRPPPSLPPPVPLPPISSIASRRDYIAIDLPSSSQLLEEVALQHEVPTSNSRTPPMHRTAPPSFSTPPSMFNSSHVPLPMPILSSEEEMQPSPFPPPSQPHHQPMLTQMSQPQQHSYHTPMEEDHGEQMQQSQPLPQPSQPQLSQHSQHDPSQYPQPSQQPYQPSQPQPSQQSDHDQQPMLIRVTAPSEVSLSMPATAASAAAAASSVAHSQFMPEERKDSNYTYSVSYHSQLPLPLPLISSSSSSSSSSSIRSIPMSICEVDVIPPLSLPLPLPVTTQASDPVSERSDTPFEASLDARDLESEDPIQEASASIQPSQFQHSQVDTEDEQVENIPVNSQIEVVVEPEIEPEQIEEELPPSLSMTHSQMLVATGASLSPPHSPQQCSAPPPASATPSPATPSPAMTSAPPQLKPLSVSPNARRCLYPAPEMPSSLPPPVLASVVRSPHFPLAAASMPPSSPPTLPMPVSMLDGPPRSILSTPTKSRAKRRSISFAALDKSPHLENKVSTSPVNKKKKKRMNPRLANILAKVAANERKEEEQKQKAREAAMITLPIAASAAATATPIATAAASSSTPSTGLSLLGSEPTTQDQAPSLPPTTASMVDWDVDMHLSMNLTACSPPDTIEHHAATSAATSALRHPTTPIVAAAVDSSSLLYDTSPVKPPLLPLSQNEEDEKKQVSTAPTATAVSSRPLASSSSSSSVAAAAVPPATIIPSIANAPTSSQCLAFDDSLSQVYDDAYYEPWMEQIKFEPKSEPKLETKVDTSAAASASSQHHLSISSSTASLSPSPPNFIAPTLTVVPISTTTAGAKIESRLIDRQRIKQEKVETATTATTSPRATTRSPNHEPLRAPPSFLSPQPESFESQGAKEKSHALRAQVKQEKTAPVVAAASINPSATASTTPSTLKAPSKPRVKSGGSKKRPLSPSPSQSQSRSQSQSQEHSSQENDQDEFALPNELTRAHEQLRSVKLEKHAKREKSSGTHAAPSAAAASSSSAASVAPSTVALNGPPKRTKLSHREDVPDSTLASDKPKSQKKTKNSTKSTRRVVDGAVQIELAPGGIDNRMLDVQDGQVMEDIDEFAEEPVSATTSSSSAAASASDTKKKSKKRKAKTEGKEPTLDKKQKTITDAMLGGQTVPAASTAAATATLATTSVVKGESRNAVAMQLDEDEDEDMLIDPPLAAACAAAAASAASASSSSSKSVSPSLTTPAKVKKAKPLDPKQQLLASFFSRPTNIPLITAPTRPDIILPALVSIVPELETHHDVPLPMKLSSSKRTYAKKESVRPEQKTPQQALQHQHETIDLVESSSGEKDEEESEEDEDEEEEEESAPQALPPPPPRRSNSEPLSIGRLQRQLDTHATAVTKPIKQTKVKTKKKATVPLPPMPIRFEEEEESQEY